MHLGCMSPILHRAAAAAAALCLAACATASAASPTTGRLYHYVRTNQDGSLPEHVWVYRRSETVLDVVKIASACANAAFVTAELDLARGQPVRLVGGRLAEDGSQQPFAWLEYANGALHARVPQAAIDQRVAIAGEPRTIYDFDLSDWTALRAGRPDPRQDFRVAVALIWPEDGADSPFRDLGWADARHVGDETHLGARAARYELSGGLTGSVWFDARQGHVIEARFDQPNHMEYETFQLTLQSVEDNAEASFAAVRESHWANCP